MARSSPQTGPTAAGRTAPPAGSSPSTCDSRTRAAARPRRNPTCSGGPTRIARPTCSVGRTAGGGRSVGIRTPGPGATRAGRNGTGSWRTSTRAESRRSSAAAGPPGQDLLGAGQAVRASGRPPGQLHQPPGPSRSLDRVGATDGRRAGLDRPLRDRGPAQRILAGQEAARARGLRWGGSEKGRRVKVTPELEARVKLLSSEGRKISHIARETGVSRPTIYKVLGEESPSTDRDPQSRKRGGSGA